MGGGRNCTELCGDSIKDLGKDIGDSTAKSMDDGLGKFKKFHIGEVFDKVGFVFKSLYWTIAFQVIPALMAFGRSAWTSLKEGGVKKAFADLSTHSREAGKAYGKGSVANAARQVAAKEVMEQKQLRRLKTDEVAREALLKKQTQQQSKQLKTDADVAKQQQNQMKEQIKVSQEATAAVAAQTKMQRFGGFAGKAGSAAFGIAGAAGAAGMVAQLTGHEEAAQKLYLVSAFGTLAGFVLKSVSFVIKNWGKVGLVFSTLASWFPTITSFFASIGPLIAGWGTAIGGFFTTTIFPAIATVIAGITGTLLAWIALIAVGVVALGATFYQAYKTFSAWQEARDTQAKAEELHQKNLSQMSAPEKNIKIEQDTTNQQIKEAQKAGNLAKVAELEKHTGELWKQRQQINDQEQKSLDSRNRSVKLPDLDKHVRDANTIATTNKDSAFTQIAQQKELTKITDQHADTIQHITDNQKREVATQTVMEPTKTKVDEIASGVTTTERKGTPATSTLDDVVHHLRTIGEKNSQLINLLSKIVADEEIYELLRKHLPDINNNIDDSGLASIANQWG